MSEGTRRTITAFHLSIEVDDGRLTATMSAPTPLWRADHGENLNQDHSQWAGAIAAAGGMLLVAGRHVALVVEADGTITELDPPGDWVSEIRTRDSGRFTALGACQPAATGFSSANSSVVPCRAGRPPSRWNSGHGWGMAWGGSGTDPGRFDLGPGGRSSFEGGQDFAGSIAVDEDGFIYVADAGNRRIQKFAP